jgi:arsenate reductase (thioredoxin)
MAAAIFNREVGGLHEARSAGTRPSSSPSPLVIEAMSEIGIDISEHRSRELSQVDLAWADLIVIAGSARGLPDLPEKDVTVWELRRIKGQPLEVMREAREEIRGLVSGVVRELERTVHCPDNSY